MGAAQGAQVLKCGRMLAADAFIVMIPIQHRHSIWVAVKRACYCSVSHVM